MNLKAFQDDPIFGFVDWILRGVGQVVFQNNPLSGTVILVALFYNSSIYGCICLLGVIVSTLTAMLLKADRGLIKDGLFGVNGALNQQVRTYSSAREFLNQPLDSCPACVVLEHTHFETLAFRVELLLAG